MERNEFLSALVCICVSLSLCLLLQGIILILSSGTCNSPCSYRQPVGRGQLLSRRYCKHSGWLFSCASRTATESQGALAVSCKYFKQSKWPFSAASNTHLRYIDHTYAQQDIQVCEDDHLKPPKLAVLQSQGALTFSRKYLSTSR